MDFTREPVIETVITPREGHKIVIRSSKTVGQEEYFVDAVEVVCFGNSTFFRSLERPKAFLVPTSDYEVLEVREARIVLKNVGLERSIKIPAKESPQKEKVISQESAPQSREDKTEGPHDRRKDRRRQQRRKRGASDTQESSDVSESISLGNQKMDMLPPKQEGEIQDVQQMGALLSSLLTPPPTLISDTLARYKENALFKDAFYTKEELEEEVILPELPIVPPEVSSFEVTIEESNLFEQKESGHLAQTNGMEKEEK